MHKCARSARFVCVAQTSQNKRKSLKMTIYSHSKRQESSKYVSFISKIEPPEFAHFEPSPKAPEARFVGVSQTLQNKRKSIKMTIYSHSKRPESSKYVSFINKIELPKFAQLDPSRVGVIGVTWSHLGENQAPLPSGSRPVAQKVFSR